jgi:hypothetical protein
LIRIYSAANLPEAHLLMGLLADAGIRARVLNEYAQGGMGEIPFPNACPEVWIEREADRERALAVVRTYERRGPDPAPRLCAHCGEENPGSFETCWRCGRSLV